MIDSALILDNFRQRDNHAQICTDELQVRESQMNSVISAQFNTDELFIRGEFDKYSLSTEFSATRNPLTESNDSFVFDRITVSPSN